MQIKNWWAKNAEIVEMFLLQHYSVKYMTRVKCSTLLLRILKSFCLSLLISAFGVIQNLSLLFKRFRGSVEKNPPLLTLIIRYKMH